MSGVPLVDAGPELIEREQESAVLDGLVDRLRDGGGAIVVRGEAGIGKSALLQRVRMRAEAQGVRPLITVGVESEVEFAFAGLHQLLRPVIGALAELPESQRQTLEAALGLGVDLKPDSFRVAVAVYRLICEVAGPFHAQCHCIHWPPAGSRAHCPRGGNQERAIDTARRRSPTNPRSRALERIGRRTLAGSPGAGAASGFAREGSRRIVRQPPGAC